MAHNIKVGETILAGNGYNKSPAGPVPDVQRGDCDRVPKEDYERTDRVGQAWIRRAVLAEAFAKSLESELEKKRNCLASGV